MSIVLYHGSNEKFDQFLIDEKLAKHGFDSLVEGYGIYLTGDIEMAKGYGHFLYTVEIENKDISDFINQKYLKQLIKIISKEVKLNLEQFIPNYVDLIDSATDGNISVRKFYKEINDLLDSNSRFHEKMGHLVTYDDHCIYQRIENSFFKNVKDIWKYYDSSFEKNIYICFRNPDNLRIVHVKEG